MPLTAARTPGITAGGLFFPSDFGLISHRWQGAVMKSSVDKRSVSIAGRSTSVSLEKPLWDCLQEIAEERGESLNQLIASIQCEAETGQSVISHSPLCPS